MHRQVIILSLLWPKLKVLLSKRDIDAAFKRVLLSLFEIDLFASDLPAEEILHLAWEAATPSERKEILESALEFAPHLDGLPAEEAWKSLARANGTGTSRSLRAA